jgi:hypothetical protein
MSRKQEANRQRDEYFRSLEIAKVRRIEARKFAVSSEDRLQLGMLTSGWPEYLKTLKIELTHLAKRKINRADDAAAALNTLGFKTGYGRLWTARLVRVANTVVFGQQRDVATPRTPRAPLSPQLSPSGQPKLLLIESGVDKGPRSSTSAAPLGVQQNCKAKRNGSKSLSKAAREARKLRERQIEQEQKLQTLASRRERQLRLEGMLKDGDPSMEMVSAAKGFSFILEKKPRRVLKRDRTKSLLLK